MAQASTLPELLALQARGRGDAPALQFGDQTIGYAELAARADRMAALLGNTWGVRPGERIAWLGLNHPQQLVLLFALARLGAVLLPLNIRLAVPEWQAVLADCGAARLLHDATFAVPAQALGAAGGLPVHPLETLDGAGGGPPPDRAAPDVPLLLVYTSGTSGRPKGALHTQANLLANMAMAAAVQQLTPPDRVLTVLPLFHVGGLCIQTLPALGAGATVLLQPRFAPDATFDAIERQRPTLTLQVPATMKALVDDPRWPAADLGSLRAVWAGSSLLPEPLVQAFHARGLPVCNVYGATETGPFSIALPPAQAVGHVGSCGWPAPGVEVRLAGLQQGVGEVWLRAPNVVQRYWPDQPATDGEGWFHTGDLARQAGDGSYTIVGRARDLIISGGENIHPAELEAPLAAHPDVLECAAFGLPDADWGEVVAMAVVLRPGAACTDAQLREHLAQRVARYKLPRRWLRLDALPKTALGKVQRAVLAARAGPQAG
ncbi:MULTISPECIES: class I adenylate-forming enzyme family protein [Ramlibacter]|uniref:AMP-binding protein n=1 Tax=Ramlibacter pinisoli TaxID=2682844 RepID=A0A6N8IMJ8_9BURK|nr:MULTISPECIES: AMP-binding protein [Ramlibacter]MBA2960684.1 AMP-binding protein [Ramlibacter sp. CGMCC 1.13660]MVQ28014.1 AMP-binding protein [Ramlibacter pinisoli]